MSKQAGRINRLKRGFDQAVHGMATQGAGPEYHAGFHKDSQASDKPGQGVFQSSGQAE